MSRYRSTIICLLFAFATGCFEDPETEQSEDALSAAYKAQVKNRTLTITGTSSGSRVALRLASPTVLAIDVGDDGIADLTFDRSTFDRISLDAGGGDDVIRIDESNGAFTNEEITTLAGGTGNDTILGGIGDETLAGGTGNDTIVGGRGNDKISAGGGDDVVAWNPGDGSDVVDGGDGTDTFVLQGAAASETIALAPNGTALHLTRDIGLIAMDLTAVENTDLHAGGGSDRVTVASLAGTAVKTVNVDLATVDGLADTVVVGGTTLADTIHVARDGADVVASGLAATVRVTGGEPAFDRLAIATDASDLIDVDGSAGADTLTVIGDPSGPLVDLAGSSVLVAPAGPYVVNGLGGDDTLLTQALTTPVTFDGGDGNDRLTGGAGADTLIGGAGDDTVDGGQGADLALLGAGADTFVWNPGGASDVVEGGDGLDTLAFHGANVGEHFDLRGNGPRVRLQRDIATVTMDAAGVEHVQLTTLGGQDAVVIGALGGTGLAQVDVDLAAAPGTGTGDAIADTVTLDGVVGVDPIDVARAGTDLIATALGTTVRVTGGEPALDRMVASGGALRVNGSADADTIAAIADSAGIHIDLGASLPVAPGSVASIALRGQGGADTLTASGASTPLVLDGGDGADTLIGSRGADTLLGGAGDDVIVWNPGDGSDVIDGGDGVDTLAFHGANIGEHIELHPDGARARLTRDIALITLDLGTVEHVSVDARGGADVFVIDDLSGTPVNDVSLDLAATPGDPAGDAVVDTVSVIGSPLAETITIDGVAGTAVVSGLPATVRIAHPDAFDQLAVSGAGGVDTITQGAGFGGLMQLAITQD